MKKLILTTLTALALAPAALSAQAQNDALVVVAQNVTAAEAQRSGDALPGDVIRYELRFTNTGNGPVRNVVFDNPIPAGMRYEVNSARGSSAVVTYSIDGGRTFSAQPMIEQVVDGQRRIVSAPVTMYTHVRWTLGGTVRPGAQVVAEYQARVVPAAPSNVF